VGEKYPSRSFGRQIDLIRNYPVWRDWILFIEFIDRHHFSTPVVLCFKLHPKKAVQLHLTSGNTSLMFLLILIIPVWLLKQEY
jgi:hypothetical protein